MWRGYQAGPDGLEILVIGAPNLGGLRATTSMASATGGLTSARPGTMTRTKARERGLGCSPGALGISRFVASLPALATKKFS